MPALLPLPRLAALLAACTVAALAGCGADEDGESTTTSTSGSPSAGDEQRLLEIEDKTATSLGEFDLQAGSPVDAEQIHGEPTTSERSDETCRVEWSELGLVIDFVDLGGGNPCGPQGRVGALELVGDAAAEAGWSTGDGIQVGISEAELREIYPDARKDFGQLILIERPNPYGGGLTPTLGAGVAGGEVAALQVYVGAGGE